MFKAFDESVWRTRRGLYRCTFACASDGEQSVQYGCVDQSFQRQGRRYGFIYLTSSPPAGRIASTSYTSCTWQVISPDIDEGK